MRGRLVPPGVAARLVLLWAALGLVAGAAVGVLVHLEGRRSVPGEVVYRGRYALMDGTTMSRAYESTLHITFSGQHHRDLAVLAGIAIGLLAGLAIGLALSSLARRGRPTTG